MWKFWIILVSGMGILQPSSIMADIRLMTETEICNGAINMARTDFFTFSGLVKENKVEEEHIRNAFFSISRVLDFVDDEICPIDPEEEACKWAYAFAGDLNALYGTLLETNSVPSTYIDFPERKIFRAILVINRWFLGTGCIGIYPDAEETQDQSL